MMLAQQSAFRETGLVRQPRAMTREAVGSIRHHLVGELERSKMWSSGKTVCAAIRKLPAFQQIARLSTQVKLGDRQVALLSEAMLDGAVRLAGTSLQPSPAQLLISPPRQGEWTLQGLNWHVDVAASSDGPPPGIQAFVLLDDVKPHGGATLALAGSHRWTGHETRNRALREVLRREADPTDALRDLELSIVEMAGDAGDVYLMDMRTLHTPSVNATDRPRLMATVRFFPR